jgi:hypothetical protein
MAAVLTGQGGEPKKPGGAQAGFRPGWLVLQPES